MSDDQALRQACDKFANDFRAYLNDDLEIMYTQELAMRAIELVKQQLSTLTADLQEALRCKNWGEIYDWHEKRNRKLVELTDQLAQAQQTIERLEKDVVPRSRYDACNQDWLDALEKLKNVQEAARAEINRLIDCGEVLRKDNVTLRQSQAQANERERTLREVYAKRDLIGFVEKDEVGPRAVVRFKFDGDAVKFIEALQAHAALQTTTNNTEVS